MDLLECCDICGEEHNTVMCPELGLPSSQLHTQLATRARLTLPPNLEVVDNGQGYVGVVAKETIEKRTQFGPYEAKRTTHVFEDNEFFTLKLLGKDGTVVVLDTTDENECNWLCLVRSAASEDTQNCMAYQLGTNIFYNATRDISVGEELQVWYAPHFAKKLGKPSLPDPSYKVLLGHRIEPLPALFQEEDQDGDGNPDESESSQSWTRDVNQPTGEIVKVFQCPRCNKEFKTQTDMVQHLRDHILPNPTKDKNSQTYRGRGRPRIHHIKGEAKPITPKRKRGRPRKDESYSHKSFDSETLTEEDSADESDEDHEKRPRLGEPEQAGIKLKIVTADDNSIDENYSPTREVDLSKRRVQPRRTSRGQHSKYGKDFVVAKIGNFDTKVEVDVGTSNKNDIESVNAKETQTESEYGQRSLNKKKGRGRPRKSKMHTPEYETGLNKEPVSDNSFSLKFPIKTYTRRENVGKVNENQDHPEIKNKTSGEHALSDKDLNFEKIMDGVQIKVVVKTEEDLNCKPFYGNGSKTDELNEVSVPSSETNEVRNEKKDGTCNVLVNQNDTSDEVEEPGDSLVINCSSLDIDEIGNAANIMDEIIDTVRNVNTEKSIVSQESLPNVHNEGNTESRVIHNKKDSNEKDDEMHEKISEPELESHKLHVEVVQNSGRLNGENENKESNESIQKEDFDMDDNESENTKLVDHDKVDDKIIFVVEKDGTLYKCGVCGKVFARLNYLKLHIPKHTDKFKCEKCGKKFTRNDSLQKHRCEIVKTLLEQPLEEIVKRQEIDGKESYQCLKCNENFDAQIEAIAHYMTHSTEGLSCLKCNKSLQNDETLQNHKCTAEESDNFFSCDLCNQTFTSAKYLHRHLVMHTDLFKCKKCNFCFSRKDSLQKHIMKCCPELAESYKIHYCSLCYRVFSTKSGKLNHVSKCKWVRCEKCSRVFSSSEDMAAHECYEEEKLTENSGIEFSCGKCGKTFLNNYYLKQHQTIHEETFKCNVCTKYLKSQEELSTHESICHMIQKIRTSGEASCDLCEKVFRKPKDLRVHYHTHTHPYSCPKCEKRFTKESGKIIHSCKIVEGTYDCEECQKSFTSNRFLTRHIAATHSKHIFKCSQCGKGFNRRLKYQNHVCKLEDGTYGNVILKKGNVEVLSKLICETCGKTFSSRSNLNKHVVSHGERQCRCPHCDKMFHYETYLRDHISSVHLNLFRFQCTDCGKLMKSKTGLIAHVKQFHRANAEIFTCEVCGKCFKQKGNLNTHMYSHQTQRSFVCEFCHKTFKYPDQLSRHKLIHTMVNKFQCRLCDKKFVKEYELKRHEMIFHSGLVYVCAMCFARCGHKHTLIRHYKRKHPSNVEDLSVPGIIDGMLKRLGELEDLPESSTVETFEVEDNQGIETPLNITLIKDNINIVNGPIMPPQDAAEVLHSLSNAGSIIEPLPENRKSDLEPSMMSTGSVGGNQTFQIKMQPPNDTQQAASHLPQEQMVTSDPSQLEFEVRLAETGENVMSSVQGVVVEDKLAENTITMDNGMININGQYIPISNLHAIPQEGDSGEAAEGQIVILQIWDPNSEEPGSEGHFIQLQAEQGEASIGSTEQTNTV